jgi:hypothetical protein
MRLSQYIIMLKRIHLYSPAETCPDYAKAIREENKKNIDEYSTLLKDILFKTPSGASSEHSDD